MKNWPVIAIGAAAPVEEIATDAALDAAEAAELTSIHAASQVESLRVALVALIFIALVSLFFSRGIPTEIAGRPREEPADGGDNLEEVRS